MGTWWAIGTPSSIPACTPISRFSLRDYRKNDSARWTCNEHMAQSLSLSTIFYSKIKQSFRKVGLMKTSNSMIHETDHAHLVRGSKQETLAKAGKAE